MKAVQDEWTAASLTVVNQGDAIFSVKEILS
jgi:hypothetical protein